MSRKSARELIFKLVFEHSFQSEIEYQTLYADLQNNEEENIDITAEDDEFITSMVEGIEKNQSSIDEKIKAHLKDWNFERLSQIDIAILRVSIYEICYREDIPDKVSVNEAIELAKMFSDETSPKFINGVLAEIIKDKE